MSNDPEGAGLLRLLVLSKDPIHPPVSLRDSLIIYAEMAAASVINDTIVSRSETTYLPWAAAARHMGPRHSRP